VDAGDPGAEIRLVVADEQLWFTPPSGELIRGTTPAIGIPGDAAALQAPLEGALRRIAKATNLLKLAAGSAEFNGAIAVDVMVRPGSAKSEFVPVNWASRPDLVNGNEFRIDIANASKVPLDVTLLYIDTQWGVTPLYPQTPGRNNRINPGARDRIGGGGLNGTLTVNADPAGIEHLLVIAVPAQAEDLLADYSFLSQPSLDASRGNAWAVPRGARFSDLLVSAGFTGGITRGHPLQAGADGIYLGQFTFRTVK
jgi:hypothetical protein